MHLSFNNGITGHMAHYEISPSGEILKFEPDTTDNAECSDFIRPCKDVWSEFLRLELKDLVRWKYSWERGHPLDIEGTASVVCPEVLEGPDSVTFQFNLYDFHWDGKISRGTPLPNPIFQPRGEWNLLLTFSPLTVSISINGGPYQQIPPRNIPAYCKILDCTMMSGHIPERLKEMKVIAWGKTSENLRALAMLPNLKEYPATFRRWKDFKDIKINPEGETMNQVLGVSGQMLQKCLYASNHMHLEDRGMTLIELQAMKDFYFFCEPDIDPLLEKYDAVFGPNYGTYDFPGLFSYLAVAGMYYPIWGLDGVFTLIDRGIDPKKDLNIMTLMKDFKLLDLVEPSELVLEGSSFPAVQNAMRMRRGMDGLESFIDVNQISLSFPGYTLRPYRSCEEAAKEFFRYPVGNEMTSYPTWVVIERDGTVVACVGFSVDPTEKLQVFSNLPESEFSWLTLDDLRPFLKSADT